MGSSGRAHREASLALKGSSELAIKPILYQEAPRVSGCTLHKPVATT
jgi:hypothetical protein